MLEQEIASIIKYILNIAGNPSPYYDEVPEGFLVPSVFFPPPEIMSGGGTLSTYTLSYTWFIKFFHSDTPSAQSLGLEVLAAMQRERNRIPRIDDTGHENGEIFHIKDPSLKKVDSARGVAQLTLSWDSPRPYSNPYAQAEKVASISLSMYTQSAYREAVRSLADNTENNEEEESK